MSGSRPTTARIGEPIAQLLRGYYREPVEAPLPPELRRLVARLAEREGEFGAALTVPRATIKP